MTDHPITPPPELVQQWAKDRALLGDDTPLHIYIATRAAQWSADQELEACCEWLQHDYLNIGASALRAARRPKPPSLKEQALETLKYPKDFWSEAEVDTIRLALEQLDD